MTLRENAGLYFFRGGKKLLKSGNCRSHVVLTADGCTAVKNGNRVFCADAVCTLNFPEKNSKMMLYVS